MAAGYFALLNHVTGTIESLVYWPDLEGAQAELEWRLWPLESQQRGADGRGNVRCTAYKGASAPSAPPALGVLGAPLSVNYKHYAAGGSLLYDKTFVGDDSTQGVWASYFQLCVAQQGGWTVIVKTY